MKKAKKVSRTNTTCLNADLERLYVTVYGKVQGVGFRAAVKRIVKKLGGTGCVWNNHDSSVKIILEGSQEVISEFLAWVRIGPLGASVSEIESKKGRYKGDFSTFSIEY